MSACAPATRLAWTTDVWSHTCPHAREHTFASVLILSDGDAPHYGTGGVLQGPECIATYAASPHLIVRSATFLEGEEALVEKYMPSLDPNDPIIAALTTVCKCGAVHNFELLDSRWNGNEVMRYATDAGDFFVKMNRATEKLTFMTEAMSLTSLQRTRTIRVPKPLHVGPPFPTLLAFPALSAPPCTPHAASPASDLCLGRSGSSQRPAALALEPSSSQSISA